MESQETYKINEINKKTLSIQFNLATIKPLIRKTRFQAFNAKFTVDNLNMRGGSFSALVKELNTIVTDLEVLLKEVDQASWMMTQSAAKAAQAEARLSFFSHSLFLASQNSSSAIQMVSRDLESNKNWLKSSVSEREQNNALFKKSDHIYPLWRSILFSRSEVVEQLDRLFLFTRRLEKLVEKINWVAVQQINLIAITALVEASWTGFQRSNIPVLALNIRALARNITQVQSLATNQLMDLMAYLGPLEKPVNAYKFSERTMQA